MNDIVTMFLAPFVLATLLVLIHTYMGLHVLEREVVFVDISLSQVAALGAGVASLFINTENSNNIYAFSISLSFCFITALILSVFKYTEKKISQEVIIGMTFAMTSAMLILVLDHSPHGAEHLKDAMIGNILFVTWKDVFLTFVVYSLVGVVHYLFRRQLWEVTRGKRSSFFWDFLFYFLFGIVITFSTHHAGVLVVFAILVGPAAMAKKLIESSLTKRLMLSWLFGVLGVFISFILSFKFDLPTGAAIVTVICLMFFMTLVISAFKNLSNRNK